MIEWVKNSFFVSLGLQNLKVQGVTVHGSEDEIFPVTNSFEIDKLISNHVLQVLDETDHYYNFHQKELTPVVLSFIKSD